MSLARSLERRLERLFEGAAGRVFSGRLHPSEMAGRIAREADLTSFEHESGPATSNRYVLKVNPADLDVDPTRLQRRLELALAEHAAEAGLRLEGPPTVLIETSDAVSPGQFTCVPSVMVGKIPPWARLVGATSYDIGPNRALVGRASDSDVVLPFEEVSRRHALIWRADSQVWIEDLGSVNGTVLDGIRISSGPHRLNRGDMIGFSGHRFRFHEGSDRA
ncbi:MAG: FhaA domain-containing protein [Acidimicrobiia bacterium]